MKLELNFDRDELVQLDAAMWCAQKDARGRLLAADGRSLRDTNIRINMRERLALVNRIRAELTDVLLGSDE